MRRILRGPTSFTPEMFSDDHRDSKNHESKDGNWGALEVEMPLLADQQIIIIVPYTSTSSSAKIISLLDILKSETKSNGESKAVQSREEIYKLLQITITILKFLSPDDQVRFTHLAKLPRMLVSAVKRNFAVTEENKAHNLAEAKELFTSLNQQIGNDLSKKELWGFIFLVVALITILGLMLKDVFETNSINIHLQLVLYQWAYTLVNNTNMTCRALTANLTNSQEEKECILSQTCVVNPCSINVTECKTLGNEYIQLCNDSYGRTISFAAKEFSLAGIAFLVLFSLLCLHKRKSVSSSSFMKLPADQAKQLRKFLNKHGLWKEQPTKLKDIGIVDVIAELKNFQIRHGSRSS